MEIKRQLENSLSNWKAHTEPTPILLRGARQVGKTYLVENFGKNNFENILSLNFEFEPKFNACFDTFNPAEILNKISLLTGKIITPGKTLLFLDEIQECPKAIEALRYFKEKIPNLHIIGAGSLLEFVLNTENFHMPVGRIQFLHLKPLSFKEFLGAIGRQLDADYLSEVSFLDKQILNPQHFNNIAHDLLLKLLREYSAIGGMPAVVKEYAETESITNCQNIQSALLNAYRLDFGKYSKRTNHHYLQRLYERSPSLIGQHFQYSKIDSEMKSRDLKTALNNLCYAGLMYRVYATSASGLPLISLINEKKFKLLFLDIGLAQRSTGLDANILLQKDLLLVNRGMIAEQFVGQELLAYANPYEAAQLFFWSREKTNSKAEVDYVITVDEHIIPVEVKAGSTGRLKSLQIFMQEKKSKLGVRVSQLPLSFDSEKRILSVPLYMISEISRLIKEILN